MRTIFLTAGTRTRSLSDRDMRAYKEFCCRGTENTVSNTCRTMWVNSIREAWPYAQTQPTFNNVS